MAATIWTFGNPTADAQWTRQGVEHPRLDVLGGIPYTSSYSLTWVGVYDAWAHRRGWLPYVVSCGDYCRIA